jgi:hypothetical protein
MKELGCLFLFSAKNNEFFKVLTNDLDLNSWNSAVDIKDSFLISGNLTNKNDNKEIKCHNLKTNAFNFESNLFFILIF